MEYSTENKTSTAPFTKSNADIRPNSNDIISGFMHLKVSPNTVEGGNNINNIEESNKNDSEKYCKPVRRRTHSHVPEDDTVSKKTRIDPYIQGDKTLEPEASTTTERQHFINNSQSIEITTEGSLVTGQIDKNPKGYDSYRQVIFARGSLLEATLKDKDSVKSALNTYIDKTRTLKKGNERKWRDNLNVTLYRCVMQGKVNLEVKCHTKYIVTTLLKEGATIENNSWLKNCINHADPDICKLLINDYIEQNTKSEDGKNQVAEMLVLFLRSDSGIPEKIKKLFLKAVVLDSDDIMAYIVNGKSKFDSEKTVSAIRDEVVQLIFRSYDENFVKDSLDKYISIIKRCAGNDQNKLREELTLLLHACSICSDCYPYSEYIVTTLLGEGATITSQIINDAFKSDICPEDICKNLLKDGYHIKPAAEPEVKEEVTRQSSMLMEVLQLHASMPAKAECAPAIIKHLARSGAKVDDDNLLEKYLSELTPEKEKIVITLLNEYRSNKRISAQQLQHIYTVVLKKCFQPMNTTISEFYCESKMPIALITYLIDYGCDVNTRNEQGQSLLHFAVRILDFNVVHALLFKGADSNLKDDAGQIPLDYASNWKPFTRGMNGDPNVLLKKQKIVEALGDCLRIV